MRLALIVALTIAIFTARAESLLVVGDSISIGYTPHLANILGPDWAVTHNPGNAQWTGFTLDNIEDWIGESDYYDVIVCNWGMHDLTRPAPGAPRRTEPEEYAENLTTLLLYMLDHADRVIVPTVTRIGPEYPAWARIDADAALYGGILADVANQLGCSVIDLHGPSAAHPAWYIADGVHFNSAGSAALAGIIAPRVAYPNVPVVSVWGILAIMAGVVAALNLPDMRRMIR